MTVSSIVPRLLVALAVGAAAFWLALDRHALDAAPIEDAVHGAGWWAPAARSDMDGLAEATTAADEVLAF